MPICSLTLKMCKPARIFRPEDRAPGEEHFDADFQAVGEVFVALDNTIKTNPAKYNLQDYFSDAPRPFTEQFGHIFMEAIHTFDAGQEHPFLSLQEKALEIRDLVAMQEYFTQKLQAQFDARVQDLSASEIAQERSRLEKDLRTLKWVISMCQLKIGIQSKPVIVDAPAKGKGLFAKLKRAAIQLFGKKTREYSRFHYISDRFMCGYISYQTRADEFDAVRSYVQRAREVKMTPTDNILGHPSAHSDDASSLRNFSKLPAGDYLISIHVGYAGHAITYIKNDDGSGVILDNNFRQLYCKDAETAKDLLLQLLSKYPSIKSFKPGYQGKKDQHHHIIISKYELISTEGEREAA